VNTVSGSDPDPTRTRLSEIPDFGLAYGEKWPITGSLRVFREPEPGVGADSGPVPEFAYFMCGVGQNTVPCPGTWIRCRGRTPTRLRLVPRNPRFWPCVRWKMAHHRQISRVPGTRTRGRGRLRSGPGICI